MLPLSLLQFICRLRNSNSDMTMQKRKGSVKDVQQEPKLLRHMSFGWLIAVLSADMTASLDERLKKIGLHIGLWPTLFALWEKEGITQAELAKQCTTANYTTTRVLDALESKGLVERRAHVSNRRVHLVYLTEEGRQLEQQAILQTKSCNEEFLSELSVQEREQIMAIVFKIIASRNPGIIPAQPNTHIKPNG
jgi:DNA-binding MarR family transcriptional regulator